MARSPNSIVTPQFIGFNYGVITASNTVLSDTPDNTVLIYTAGIDGARVVGLRSITRGSCSATVMRVFRDRDGSGSIRRLFKTRLQPAQTVDATTLVVDIDFNFSEASPLLLLPNERLYGAASIALASGFVFHVEAGDL